MTASRRIRDILGGLFVASVLLASPAALALLKVNVMPSGVASPVNAWDSGPYTWPGNSLELWGNVSYDGADPLTYTWNFGAGEGSTVGAVADPRNIAESHTYVGTGSFIATLTVTDGTTTDSDTVYIDVVPMTLQVQTNLAVQRALKYLYMGRSDALLNGQTTYYWYVSGYPVAGAGLAVLAFEDHGHRESNDMDKDIYAETVQRGLWYIFSNLDSLPASVTPTSDSDLNGNGSMLFSDGTFMYTNGILPMAIANTSTPTATVFCGNLGVVGLTYREVLEDITDFQAYAQNEDPTYGGVGGWRYVANDSSSDNSVSQWPALGMAAAAGAPWNISETNPAYPNYPAWVKTRLKGWIDFSQDAGSGGFGYTVSTDWVNYPKTGAGIIEMVFAGGGGGFGLGGSLPAALSYLDTNWTSTGMDGNFEDYAMYAVKKGLQYAGLSTIGVHDWQQEYNQWHVDNQISAGTTGVYWPGGSWIDTGMGSSIFGLLIMAPGLAELPPVANAGIDQEIGPLVPVSFDGSGSFHTDPARHIVKYEWDFDYDGVSFDVDALGVAVTNLGGYTLAAGVDTKVFTVALRVTDDSVPPRTDLDTALVTVTNDNLAPVANPGGPYLGAVGTDITLDGTASYDDNEAGGPFPLPYAGTGPGFDDILRYQWDTDGDGLYGSDDAPTDLEGAIVTVNFGPGFIGDKTIGLKVTDSFGRSGIQSTGATTVAVSDLHPVSYVLVSSIYNRSTRLWTVTWKVRMRNDGTAEATEVTAKLTGSTIPPGVTVLDDTVSWSGSIDPLETQTSDDSFSYRYARGVDISRITWDIEFRDALGTRHVVRNLPQ